MKTKIEEEKFIGFIAMIDVLGFTKMMEEKKPEDVRDKIINILSKSAESADLITNRDREKFAKYSDASINSNPIEWILFSDTILVYIKTDSEGRSQINSSKLALESIC